VQALPCGQSGKMAAFAMEHSMAAVGEPWRTNWRFARHRTPRHMGISSRLEPNRASSTQPVQGAISMPRRSGVSYVLRITGELVIRDDGKFL
jgi:hypothetical protein